MPATIKDLIGKTLINIEVLDNEKIVFETIEGDTYALHHFQECCETVSIENIKGDLNNLIGSPLLTCTESTSHETPPDAPPVRPDFETYTWTFYTFTTEKGQVDIRWLGASGCVHSEDVSFTKKVPWPIVPL